ncbi:MAG: response regulator transcription factor [Bryobacteraceae bacterium]|nr:response regulator transcription factor [Bryobacteraceae bacterium]
MPAILVIDDHPSIVEGLRTILIGGLAVGCFQAARSAEEAVAHASAKRWDLIISDISVPGRGGPELIGDLRRAAPAAPILVYTMHDETQFGVRCLRAGAQGYLTKDRDAEELLQAARRLLGGGKYITPTLAELLAEAVQNPGEPHERLSDRELQILRLLASGKSPGEIATQLHISVKTVSTYRTRVLDKLSLTSTADLIRYALSNNLS